MRHLKNRELSAKCMRKGKHDISPTLRIEIRRAFDIIQARRAMTLPELMAELIEKEGLLAVMDRMAKYVVREKSVATSVHVTGQIARIGSGETDRLIESVVAGDNPLITLPETTKKLTN